MSVRVTLTQHLNLKIAAVLAAVVLWLIAKGEQTGDREFLFPLILRNVPEGLTTVRLVPEHARIVLSGANKELLRLSLWGEPYAAIDLSGAEPDKTIRVPLSAANVVLPRDVGVQVGEVRDPKVLDLEIDRVGERKLAVLPVLTNRLEPGYHVLGEPRCVPDSVTVRGPARVVARLSSVRTAPLNLSGRRARIEASRAVDVARGVNVLAVPKEVRVIVEVEGTLRTAIPGVPVRVEREHGASAVTTVPAVVSIEVSGPEHVVAALTPADASVVVDARGLPAGIHEIAPDVVLPEGVELLSMTPSKLTVTLR